MISIEGKSFCTSAQKAFIIVVENSLRIAAINTVGDFMLFLSKLAVTALTLFLGIYWFKIPIDDPLKKVFFLILTFLSLINLYYIKIHEIKIFLLPLAVVAIISFLIAHCFFTVYEVIYHELYLFNLFILILLLDGNRCNNGLFLPRLQS